MPHHARVAPFASRVLFLSFYRDGDIETFTRQAEYFSLPTIGREWVIIDTHKLFSTERLLLVQSMIGSLPFPVAYQCDAFLYNGLLNTVELLELAGLIKSLLDEQGEQRTVDVLRRFIVILQQHLHDHAMTSETLFQYAIADLKQASSPTTRRARYENDHMCAQVRPYWTQIVEPYSLIARFQGDFHSLHHDPDWSRARRQ